ncbi:MAG: 50S ribosomal protein L9 [Spirochaetales bacterium]|nr:50S ribosomal protein L9 [Spirochaetales bacterium]
MRVILKQDIPNLGEEGDIKTVANGYARNYLIPKKFAMPYTKQNLKILDQNRVAIEKRKEAKRTDASSLKERLEAEELVFIMTAGESGKLFGSVNNSTIAEELEKRGYHIEKKRIEIPDSSIRMIGEFDIRIKLYENKIATMKIKVEKQGKKEEEKPQTE